MDTLSRKNLHLKVHYTNWRGETSLRTITPSSVYYGSSEWHPEPQWLLTAYDHDKLAVRDFALKGFGLSPDRERELLEANNRCQQEARDARAALKGGYQDRGDPIAEQALLLAAGIIGGMKRAAAHANIVGYHAEAYGAAEVELLSLAKKVKNGEEVRNHNGLVQRFGGDTCATPAAPTTERTDAKHAPPRADTRCDYCKENGFQAPNLCEDCRSASPTEAARQVLPLLGQQEGVAWLIERKGYAGTAPHWYAENPENGWHWWTAYASEAMRFASKADAEAFPAYQMIASDPAISITEHVFLAPAIIGGNNG
ncbi:hypothetical protein [Mesorhizobium sp.]|uniref:hypothetical protein n=1 Tax=Mesorhizobium sp. TaxID=1871066 RepID=UPI00257AC7D5|nr:hypothetical protein [Mesorhizobium sp.]